MDAPAETSQRSNLRGAACIVAVWLASVLMWSQAGLTRPDGVGHVVHMASTWLDHDLLFYDEWQRAGLVRDGMTMFRGPTATGYLANHWTVGPAVAWYPAFVAADGARTVVPSLRAFPRDGMALPYNVAVLAGSAILGLLALLAGYAVARRWYSPAASASAAIAVWLGTPLLWYSVRDAAMAHAASAFACALVVVLALRLREGVTGEAAFALGLALGFAAMVRIQNAAFLLVPLLVLAAEHRRSFLRKAPLFVAGGLLGILPELIVSAVIYGHPLGFASIGGRGVGWDQWTHAWLAETLFSWYHGLFTWTPVAALGVAGLFALWRVDRRVATAGLATFAIQWIANSCADRAFWAGRSFGARRFDCLAVFLLLGLAALFDRAPRVTAVLATLCCGWTMALFFAGSSLDLGAYQTFAELLDAAGAGLRGDIGGFLIFVPGRARLMFFGLLILGLTVNTVLLLAFLRTRPRYRAGVAGLYLAVISAFLAWTGPKGADRVRDYAPLIARTMDYTDRTGDYVGAESLLAYEAAFLRKAGRDDQAAKTEEELRVLRARKAAAFHTLGPH